MACAQLLPTKRTMIAEPAFTNFANPDCSGMITTAATRSPAAALAEIEHLAYWLDARWRIPGTAWRFGLDGLIGLLPVIGDTVTLLLSLYVVSVGVRLGATPATVLRMLINVAVDAVVGGIPLLGDLADIAFKANRRNLALLRRDLARRGGS